MSDKFFHDPANRTVVCMSEPVAREKKDRSGNRTEWVVEAEIETLRADNALRPKSNQWKYPLREPRQDFYPPTDSREQVIESFRAANEPVMKRVDRLTYNRFRSEYEADAKRNPYTPT